MRGTHGCLPWEHFSQNNRKWQDAISPYPEKGSALKSARSGKGETAENASDLKSLPRQFCDAPSVVLRFLVSSSCCSP